MAPLDPTNTPRYFIDYISGEEHTMMFRCAAPMSPAAFGTFIDDIFSDLNALMNQISIIGVRFAAAGSNVTNPVTTGLGSTTYGVGGVAVGADRSKFLGFQGRSSDGRRVSAQLYSLADIESSYRYTPVEAAQVDTVIGKMNAEPNFGLTISGQKAVWKSYFNTTDSAYWQKRLRA